MKKYIHDFQVINNRIINDAYFVLSLFCKQKLPEIKPGQFVQARVDNAPNTFLRRPFSVYDIDYGTNIIYLLIQVVGGGTAILSSLKKGDNLNLIYPLGNSFSLPAGKKVLLIGGGIGVAPLLLLGRWLKDHQKEPVFLLGFRTADLIVDFDIFYRFGKVFITTDDGSKGEKGIVTQHSLLNDLPDDFNMVYSCGPEAMLEAVALWSDNNSILCEMSLETYMACGFGACLCCPRKTIHGYLKVCTDGPVFKSNELIW